MPPPFITDSRDSGRPPGEASALPVISPAPPTRNTGAGLLIVASFLLLLLAAAQGYVSFRAQYVFVDHAKHARLPSVLEALGLDTGAVIFALLALSLARLGGRAAVERTLNVACALGSLTMNLLAADLTSPRSVTVWVLPSALYALASDRLIGVVRRWVLASDTSADLAQDRSAWRAVGGLTLWVLRLILDTRGTAGGFRRWVLAVAPVAPGVHASGLLAAIGATPLAVSERSSGSPAPDGQADSASLPPYELWPGEKKREALIRLYERCGETGDPRYADRSKAAQLAGEIAGRIGYHPGTARRELVRYLASRPQASSVPRSDTGSDSEAVA
ncbi:MAG TPA: hypothetical protein VMU94_28565 [Streptosporangiaceae bacterium]|nr:hypothetical protein [Streptosporangiaceae bacterium]